MSKFATGEWMHLFGAGRRETRCRIVIDLELAKVSAAQEWTGVKFVDIRGDRLKDLDDSVIDANAANLDPDEFSLEQSDELPEWARSREGEGDVSDLAADSDGQAELAPSDRPCGLQDARTGMDQVWLMAYGLGGVWSGYPYATIVSAKEKEEALSYAGIIAVRELSGEKTRSGISFDVELVAQDPRATALYASRLKPEARAMVDVHFASRDEILQHWRRILVGPAVDEEQLLTERIR